MVVATPVADLMICDFTVNRPSAPESSIPATFSAAASIPDQVDPFACALRISRIASSGFNPQLSASVRGIASSASAYFHATSWRRSGRESAHLRIL